MLMMDCSDMMFDGSLGMQTPHTGAVRQTRFDMPTPESGSDDPNGADIPKKRGRRLKGVRRVVLGVFARMDSTKPVRDVPLTHRAELRQKFPRTKSNPYSTSMQRMQQISWVWA